MHDLTTRADRLDTMIAEDRLIRNAWTDGQDRACLLVALSPEVGAAKCADACPAEVMPPWLAELTPSLGDCGSVEAWPAMVQRYAAAARRWGVLTESEWEAIRVGWLADDVIPEALSHVTTDDWGVRDACEAVRSALRSGEGLEEARDAATAAAAAVWSAPRLEAAAWLAARLAARFEAAALVAAARFEAAGLAARAGASAAAWSAARAGASAEASWDRLTDALLTRIEAST